MEFRAEQLVFRQHEIYLAYSVISRLVQRDATLEILTPDRCKIDTSTWARSNPPVKLNQDIVLAGHSFGGCTVVSMR
jgi:platelet-activating factor acetylhydrolase